MTEIENNPTQAAHDAIHPEAARAWGGQFYPWKWREPSHGEHYRTCSWCGCINPEDLAAEPTWIAAWADRKYGWPHKFYINIPNREPKRLFAIGGTSRFTEDGRARGYIPFEELTAEQLAICERDHWRTGTKPGEGVMFGTRAHHHAKFYTIHLADPTLPAEVVDAIGRHSGLVFEFRDGRVSWHGYPYEEQHRKQEGTA